MEENLGDIGENLWSYGRDMLSGVGKQSIDIVKDAVLPEIERISYNITDKVLREFSQNINNLTENAKQDFVPEFERLTTLLVIGLLVSGGLIFCGLLIVAFGLVRINKQGSNKAFDSNSSKNQELANGCNDSNKVISREHQNMKATEEGNGSFNV